MLFSLHRCAQAPLRRTQTRITTTPVTARCCTWSPGMKYTSNWMVAKHTEATTTNTAPSLALSSTPIRTRAFFLLPGFSDPCPPFHTHFSFSTSSLPYRASGWWRTPSSVPFTINMLLKECVGGTFCLSVSNSEVTHLKDKWYNPITEKNTGEQNHQFLKKTKTKTKNTPSLVDRQSSYLYCKLLLL